MSDPFSDNPETEPFADETAEPEETGAETVAEPSPGSILEVDDDDRLGRMMAFNFLEYASYVIRDRAIPDVADGLKPVQRRILHSLHSLDDGRFHKVANIIGHTMQYHPHGDASIGSALVVLANKEYFIERQGNFGNIYTGDEASAARYIECRLTPLAREVLFNRETTEYIDSYDGRNREPVTLPAKVPVLLMMGADGIAVGMTTRVLPHNFRELLEAQIAVLRGEEFRLYPDFQTGGIMDARDYDDGRGRIKLRARIEEVNEKTLVIREIPATTTTESLAASIEDAVKRGRIKLASINDYTAEKVEIELKLPRGIYAREVIPQLYAYTSCETSITSNIVVISGNMPVELTVTDVVRQSTEQLVRLLKLELEIKLGKLEDRFHALTLAQLFIENRIYKRIEEKETYEEVLAEVHAGLAPFRDQLRRDITDEDIEKLLQLQIRRISRFDINRNRAELDQIVEDMRETHHHLGNLTDFAIRYVEDLIERFAGAYPRQTEVMKLEHVDVKVVALQNIKVGHDRVNQFVGTEVRNSNRNDAPLACTEYDRLLLLRNDGTLRVVNIPDKLYVGPLKLCEKHNRDQVFSVLYRQRKKNGAYFAKRFKVDRFVTDREYKVLPEGCLIVGLYTNSGVEVRLDLKPSTRRQVEPVDLVFEEIPLRSLTARGFKVTSHPVDSISITKRGAAEEPPQPSAEPAPETDEGLEPQPEPNETPSVQPEPQSEPAAPGAPDEAPAGEATPRKKTKPGRKAEPEAEPETEPEAEPEAEPETEPETEPVPTTKKKGRGKRKADREPTSEPASESAPPTPQDAQDAQDVAVEWEKRSGKAQFHPSAKAEPKSKPTAEPTAEAEPKPKTEPSEAAFRPRKRIDEDTPFFLE